MSLHSLPTSIAVKLDSAFRSSHFRRSTLESFYVESASKNGDKLLHPASDPINDVDLMKALLSVASSLNAGVLSAEDVWPGKIHARESYIDSDVLYHDGTQTLRDFKASRGIMVLLLSALESKISILTEQILPATRSRGIMSLPDEILAKIFGIVDRIDSRRRIECLTETLDSDERAEGRSRTDRGETKLSLVNRHFYNVLLSHPTVCGSIHIRQSQETLERRLSMSGTSQLSLFVDPGLKRDVRGDWRIFLDASLPHRDRWYNLVFAVPLRKNNIIAEYPAEFVSLRSLEINYNSCEWEEECDIHSVWTFPNLKYVHIYGAIPPPGVFASATSLSICCPNLLSLGTAAFIDMQRLVMFLNSFRDLRSLSLDLVAMSTISAEGSYDTTRLPSLISFAISSSVFPYSADPPHIQQLRQILHAIDMPEVETLSISFNYSYYRPEDPNFGHDHWLSHFFPSPRPSVKTFRIHASPECRGIVSFADIFTCFPSLQHLEIFAPSLDFRERLRREVSIDRLPIRSLRLIDCHGLRPAALKRLLSDIKSWGGELEEISVTNGNTVSLEKIAELFPDARIEWMV
ncbi:hypothetical protein DFH11DRAFT_1541641 [Phellopilus nigrolimitatus]|nr:hypothetical protein DFH11DRAFT_1541641 [Phellopilus nigrolimitatus]